MQLSCRTNIYVVKREKTPSTSILVEFMGHKMENTKYCSNDQSNSRFVISMPENSLVPIFISCVEILTKTLA